MPKDIADQKNKQIITTEFLFGAALSAHQVEGNNIHSDWWKFEQEVLSKKGISSDIATNHYELFDEDFELAKKLGHNAHRFSIEWAKVEPEKGKIDFTVIEHYKRVLASLKAHNLKPIVTLYHFTLPQWFAKRGGFLYKRNISTFVDYAKFVAQELKDDLEFIITINEPVVYAYQSYLTGTWTPQKKKFRLYKKVLKNLAKTHNQLYHELKHISPKFKISVAKNNQVFEPARRHNILDNILVKYFKYTWNFQFLDRVKNSLDFIGLNYYFYRGVKFKRALAKNFYQFPYPTCRKSDMDWEIFPKGIYINIMDLQKRYNLPIMVTENGVADDTDKLRESFLKESLEWVFEAKKEGANVIGYIHWALTDNFEWDHGFDPRFGLIKIDYNNLSRTVRPSALLYQKLIEKYQKTDE